MKGYSSMDSPKQQKLFCSPCKVLTVSRSEGKSRDFQRSDVVKNIFQVDQVRSNLPRFAVDAGKEQINSSDSVGNSDQNYER